VEVLKKTSFGLLDRMSMPAFPAIEIDGKIVFQGCDVSQSQLEEAIKDRKQAQRA
jgi:hypothetical protein